jgi:hypothetical protein
MRVSLSYLTCVALLVVAGCDLPAPKTGEKEEKKPARTYRAGDAIDIDTLAITFGGALPMTLAGSQYGESVSARVLRVDFTLKNTSPVKIIDWGGWQGRRDAADEHGNAFRPFNPSDGFRFVTASEADAYDAAVRLDPKTSTTRHLYFQPVPPSSREITLTLPLSVVRKDSTDEVRVRLAVAHPKKDR